MTRGSLALLRSSAFLAVLSVSCVACGDRSRSEPPPDRVREDQESAHRANNRGVALLEQFAHDKAVDAFREALALGPGLRAARINLPIALFYANKNQDAEAAATAARDAYPDAPQPLYLLGLIARSANRLDAAADAFLRVLQLDPDDVGAQTNLAMVYVQQSKYREAMTLCESALTLEPYNATAAYNLGLAQTRAGDAAAGQRTLQRFEALRASAYAVTYSHTYLEQGRYGEAIASTGIEPELVDTEPPATVFGDATASLMTAATQAPATRPAVSTPLGGTTTLADLDGDGDLDAIDAGPAVRVLRNDGSRLIDITDQSGLGLVGAGAIGVVSSDVDNDNRPDVLLLTMQGPRLFMQGQSGRFQEAAAKSFRPGASRAAAFLDVDHDGDVDILLGGWAGPGPDGRATTQLLRNNLGTFTDITAAAGLQGVASVLALGPTDFDNRRDLDVLIVPPDARPRLYRNLRDGSFRDVAPAAGLPDTGDNSSFSMGDVNKDGFTDFFFGQTSSTGTWALSDGRGRFRLEKGPPGSDGAVASQLLDYDNDGLLDLCIATLRGPRLFRNLGRSWREETERALAADLRGSGDVTSLAAGDLDLDGDTDLVAHLRGGGLRIWRNDRGGGNDRSRSLRVALTARVSNRGAVGASVEMRAGSLYQKKETAATTPSSVPSDLIFGLGRRTAADVVRVLWPSGILQAESPASSGAATTITNGAAAPFMKGLPPFTILELDRKPSSCPYLFTWNGHRFEFVTDFLGGGEMGYWEGPAKRNTPDPEEYVRIRGDQLQPKDGRFEIRVTNELEEALFADRLQLLAIAHPRQIDVFPNEGMTEPPKPFRLHAMTDQRAPMRATDDHGHDVSDRIARVDRRYPDDFPLSPLRGYSAAHTLTLDLGPITRPSVLLMTAWTDYAFSSDNLGAHQSGLSLAVPALEIRDASGAWRTAIADIGIPVGRPQTLVVDLTGRLRSGEHEVRIVTNMRIYWDQVLVATSASTTGLPTTRLDPAIATLHARGFSAEIRPDGQEPPVPDYERVTQESPWKVMPGRYTREGDVAALLARVDDMFVIAKPGDEVMLSFDAAAAGPLPDGWTRTFLLLGDGFSKEMDINSASPDTVAPLPFHRMSRYPYSWPERYPDSAEHRRYQDTYNTRVVARPYPRLQ